MFETFKRLKAIVEIEIDLKLKCLRYDINGEFIDGRFKDNCTAYGIKVEKIILWTPQPNGVTKCLNKTINECANIAYVVNTAVYLINHGPSVSLE